MTVLAKETKDIREELAGAYTATFRLRALSGEGTWAREARAAISLAARAGITLDEDMLIVCDVRDLQALQRVLRGEVRTPRQHKGVSRAASLESLDRLPDRLLKWRDAVRDANLSA